jgi:hypothetical protein
MRSREAISPTVADCGSFPSATTRRTMSRSVTIPTRRSPSTTGSGPTSSDFINRAASAIVVDVSTPFGLLVIASRMLFAINPPRCFGRTRFAPVCADANDNSHVRMVVAHAFAGVARSATS